MLRAADVDAFVFLSRQATHLLGRASARAQDVQVVLKRNASRDMRDKRSTGAVEC